MHILYSYLRKTRSARARLIALATIWWSGAAAAAMLASHFAGGTAAGRFLMATGDVVTFVMGFAVGLMGVGMLLPEAVQADQPVVAQILRTIRATPRLQRVGRAIADLLAWLLGSVFILLLLAILQGGGPLLTNFVSNVTVAFINVGSVYVVLAGWGMVLMRRGEADHAAAAISETSTAVPANRAPNAPWRR